MNDSVGHVLVKEARRRTHRLLLTPRVLGAAALSISLGGIVLGGLYVLERAIGAHPSAVLFGFLGGCVTTSAIWATWHSAFTMSGSATWHMGAEAERWTAALLGKLGPDWKMFPNVFLGKRVPDVDQVAIGPYGALAIETKFRPKEIDLNAKRLSPDVLDQVRRTEESAGRLRAVFARDAPDVPVVPVLVWWGPHIRREDVVRRQGDVWMVHGADSQEWMNLFTERRIGPEVVDRATAKLISIQERFQSSRERQ